MNKLYESLRRLILGEYPRKYDSPELKVFPRDSSQIKLLTTPIGYIRAGERALLKIRDKQRKSLENLE
jgi:hypothetical protein